MWWNYYNGGGGVSNLDFWKMLITWGVMMNGSNSDSNTIEYNKIDDGTIIHIIVTKISDYKVHVRKSKGSYVYERDIDIQISFNRMKSIYNLLNKISERLSLYFLNHCDILYAKDINEYAFKIADDEIVFYQKTSKDKVKIIYKLNESDITCYFVNTTKDWDEFSIDFSQLAKILKNYTNNNVERMIILAAFYEIILDIYYFIIYL